MSVLMRSFSLSERSVSSAIKEAETRAGGPDATSEMNLAVGAPHVGFTRRLRPE